VKATETVWQHLHGKWYPVRAEARWDAYAPLIEEPDGGYTYEDTGEVWEDTGKPKRKRVPKGTLTRKLDPNKERWKVDPEGMLAKCAEALALRKAWPDDFAGTYVEGELDRAEVIDITPTEMANEAESSAKLALMGGADALTVMWEHGARLERVPSGKFCDAVLQWAGHKDRTSTELEIWWSANLPARGEYKARHGAEYLEFQKEWERIKARVETEEVTQDPVLPGIVQAAE
jgi:hypothetical protein